MESAKGPDSLSLLAALLRQEGSVVHKAFLSLELDPEALHKDVIAHKKALGPAALEGETWIVDKAIRRAKAEGFPLATDHLLEVIWDEECVGATWLTDVVDPERLEQALNESRYLEPDENDVQPAPSRICRSDVPESH